MLDCSVTELCSETILLIFGFASVAAIFVVPLKALESRYAFVGIANDPNAFSMMTFNYLHC